MTQRRGEVPSYLVYMILGLIVLVVLSIYFIGKAIPTSYGEVRDIEKELTASWNTFIKGKPTSPQTIADINFFNTTYLTFIKELESCRASEKKDCICRLSTFTKSSEEYKITIEQHTGVGYYSYPEFRPKDANQAPRLLPGVDVFLLFADQTPASVRLCLATDISDPKKMYPVSRFTFSLDTLSNLQMSTLYRSPPPAGVPTQFSFVPTPEFQLHMSTFNSFPQPTTQFPSAPTKPDLDIYKVNENQLCFIAPSVSATNRAKLPSCDAQPLVKKPV